MCLAIPGKIVEISSENQDSALVEVIGVRRRIDLGLLQDDKPAAGDWVLVHVGFAMSKISEQDAADQMNTLRMLGEIDGAMQEVQGYGLEWLEPSTRKRNRTSAYIVEGERHADEEGGGPMTVFGNRRSVAAVPCPLSAALPLSMR